MALYKVSNERLRLPAHRLAVGGVAGPDASKEEKVLGDNGAPDRMDYPLERGDIVYTEQGDTDSLPEGVNAFYCYATSEVERYEGLDALEKVEDPSSLGSESDPRYTGIYGQDDGTDVDTLHGDELRAAEAAAPVDTEEEAAQKPVEGDSGGTAKPKNKK